MPDRFAAARDAAIEVLQLAGQTGDRGEAAAALGLEFASAAERLSYQAYGAAMLAFQGARPPSLSWLYLEAAALLASGWTPGQPAELRQVEDERRAA